VTVTLDESGRWAGANRWLESRLFEVIGSWVQTTPDPETKLMLDRHSRHHAWRAAQWLDRLPVLADVDRDELTAPPSGRVREVLDKLESLEGTPARVAGAYRVVLPRLWSRYDRHRQVAGEAGDSSTLRTVGILLPDVAADWHEGETRLHELLTDDEAIGAAAATVVALEGWLAGSTGAI
jgi:hypothetical protein